MIKAPFPYFGGKSAVADVVWSALGNVGHYMEPFFGSGAVLLRRPKWQGKTETVCDADGHLANVWRALQSAPDDVARVCDWPVNHADLMARKKVLNDNTESLLSKLSSNDEYYDAKLAGYWIWAASCWIGAGLIRPMQIPRISGSGTGVHAKIPHINRSGVGVHAKIPHICDSGMGVHAKIPYIGDGDRDVRDPYVDGIYEWFRQLSERLRKVRVVCGDWTRICGGNWQNRMGVCGIFFDPPYGEDANRTNNIYAHDSLSVADAVRKWCISRGNDPTYRIVLAGYFDEHKSLLDIGWTVHRWSANGGYGNVGNGNGKKNRHKEALFFSPYCISNKQITLFGGQEG